jgi:hypothetical protein
MTLSVDAAQRQSIVPLQQTASSRLAGAFGPRFVTGSQSFKLNLYNAFALSIVAKSLPVLKGLWRRL